MIEGLKVTVTGAELKDLCLKQASHHEGRYAAYNVQIASMQDNDIGREAAGKLSGGGDPVQQLKTRRDSHGSDADELRFIANHLQPHEFYLLDRSDLHRLGITRERY